METECPPQLTTLLSLNLSIWLIAKITEPLKRLRKPLLSASVGELKELELILRKSQFLK